LRLQFIDEINFRARNEAAAKVLGGSRRCLGKAYPRQQACWQQACLKGARKMQSPTFQMTMENSGIEKTATTYSNDLKGGGTSKDAMATRSLSTAN